MKKFFCVMLMIAFSAVSLSACGGKNVTVYDIDGTWENVMVGRVTTGTAVYTFKTDYTYTHTYSSSSEVISISTDEQKGTYSLSGNTITLKDDSESTSFEVEFRDGNMIWITDAGKERIFTRK